MTLEYTALLLAGLLLVFFLKRQFYSLFIIILLTTEFFYVQIGGGVARPYHFLAVLVVLVLARYVPLLFQSKVFIALLIFFMINVCAVILSDTPDRASASFLSFCANLAIAMATALILLTGKLPLAKFKRIILTVTLVSICWGVVQIIAYRLLGITLALSPEQAAQIQIGLGPAFRTEANTFGKYMVLPFLLFLPEYLENQTIRNVNKVFVLLFVGIIMNFTRTSIYGIGISFLFIFIWYGTQRKLGLITGKLLALILMGSVGLILVLSDVIKVSEYNIHKLNTLFNQEEILEGGSSGYRLEMMRLVVSNALDDSKKMVIGNGWGQTHVYYNDVKVQAGGGDWVNILGYSGILGLIAYFAYTYMAFLSVLKLSKSNEDTALSRFSEGSMFALLGIFFTAQMSGYLIAPEYWMLIGICIYCSLHRSAIYREA